MEKIIRNFWLDIDKQMDLFLINPLVVITFIAFLLYAGYHDIKTYKITNKFNKTFLLTGLAFMLLEVISNLAGWENRFIQGIDFGMTNIYGAIVGFLILFIPGMILNHAFGGDIKFIAVIGFWLGAGPVLFTLFIFIFVQIIYWLGAFYIWKDFGQKKTMAFGPFFAIGVVVLIIMSYLL